MIFSMVFFRLCVRVRLCVYACGVCVLRMHSICGVPCAQYA